MELKEFNSEKLINRTSKSMGWDIAVICIGLVMMLFEDWSKIITTKGFFKVLDSLFFQIFGFILYQNASQRVKRIKGNYIKFQDTKFDFKSRNEIGSYSDVLNLKEIEIKLETIKIIDDKDLVKTIYLDDYIGDGEQKEIKLIFNRYKELKSKHNSSQV